MRIMECLLLKNGCYKKYHRYAYQPTGIVVHSTDKAGKVIKRFVQPYDGQTSGLSDNGKAVTAEQMISILGKNINANDWNREKIGTKTLEACVHAFLGQVADGSYAVCKTLPYTMPCWGAGSGRLGSYNGCFCGHATPPLYIQFEMIEDSGSDKSHCKKLYDLAVEYCAYLCKMYPSIKIADIISHKEACARGRGSNHGDPESYWSRCGMSYTMDGFRRDVQTALDKLNQPAHAPTPAPVTTPAPAAPASDMITDIHTAPAWAQPALRELLDGGYINGGTDAETDPDDINLTLDTIKSILVAKRYIDAKIKEIQK